MFADIYETCWVHTLFSLKNTSTASYFTLKCVICVGMSVFVLVYVISPTASTSNSILTYRDASWQDTAYWVRDCRFQPKKPRYPTKNLYEQEHIKKRINQLINLHNYLSLLGLHSELRSFLLRESHFHFKR